MKMKLLFLSLLLVALVSCGEKKIDLVPEVPETSEQMQKLADSIYNVINEVYYWNVPVVTIFNPQKYAKATALETAEAMMEALRDYSPNGWDTYSYAEAIAGGGSSMSAPETDYGFGWVPVTFGESGTYSWYVTHVYDQSEAGLAGVKRGWIIDAIDGQKIGGSVSNFETDRKKVIDVFTLADNDRDAVFTFKKTDGTTQTNTLHYKVHTSKSVLFQKIINTTNNKKVGYFVFGRFNAGSDTELRQVISSFETAGVDDVILDLRYNGGGLTSVQDLLANLLAPANTTGKMYTCDYNTKLKNREYPYLKQLNQFKFLDSDPDFFSKDHANNNVNFAKTNALNLSRLFVLTTRETASASELLINNLRPKMNVQVIGKTTYGKPMGFFGINFMNKVTIWPASFKTANSQGVSDYYTGLVPDRVADDGVTYDFGDVQENMLKTALYYIENAAYPSSATANRSAISKALPNVMAEVNEKMGKNRMIVR